MLHLEMQQLLVRKNSQIGTSNLQGMASRFLEFLREKFPEISPQVRIEDSKELEQLRKKVEKLEAQLKSVSVEKLSLQNEREDLSKRLENFCVEKENVSKQLEKITRELQVAKVEAAKMLLEKEETWERKVKDVEEEKRVISENKENLTKQFEELKKNSEKELQFIKKEMEELRQNSEKRLEELEKKSEKEREDTKRVVEELNAQLETANSKIVSFNVSNSTPPEKLVERIKYLEQKFSKLSKNKTLLQEKCKELIKMNQQTETEKNIISQHLKSQIEELQKDLFKKDKYQANFLDKIAEFCVKMDCPPTAKDPATIIYSLLQIKK